jgi:Glycosyl transferases group 1
MKRSFRQAFVVGAYLPNGGTHMAYHLGRILQRDFGIPTNAVRVAEESPDNGIHNYDLLMPIVSIEQMEKDIGADDILVANPSFSNYQFGMRLPGFKLCYVQHFNTFAVLDMKADRYVAVSKIVADFLRATYAIDTDVIPAFIELDHLPVAAPWDDRPSAVLPYRKGLQDVWNPSYAILREIIARRAPHIEFSEPLAAVGIPHAQLLARIGAVRHLLMLSAAEGFGLVPLEAMAMGTLVTGYDGFGGRDYMRPGENCAVAPYPDIELVAERLIEAVDNPERGRAMAMRGHETAQNYSYSAFRRAWISELEQSLGIRAITSIA